MKITADENIIFAEEAFSNLGEIELLPGREISNVNLKNTDVLIVRSVTQVNEELLKDTNVKFVGTATIGDDHIDKNYLNERNIFFTNAKGCNAQAVTEYIFSAVSHLAFYKGITLSGRSIGIIGVGNIGRRAVKFAEALGMRVIKNDPPLQSESGSDEFAPLEDALRADIVTFHVPLNIGGQYNTFHLLNECNLNLINPGAILINASRGAVIDNNALKNYLRKNKKFYTVLDVWENEPAIDLELLNLIDIATPHVAGYSYEGKVNGTVMIYEAVCEFFNKEKTWQPTILKVDNNIVKLKSGTLEQQLYDIFSFVYPITKDDTRMRELPESGEPGELFDKLRKEYPLRRELSNYKAIGNLIEKLAELF